MNKGNLPLSLTFFIQKLTVLFLGVSTIIIPLNNQALSSTAKPAPTATPSPTENRKEESSSVISLAFAIIAGITGILTSLRIIAMKDMKIGRLKDKIEDLEKEEKFVTDILLVLGKQSEEMKNMVEMLGEYPTILKSEIYRDLKDKINEYHNDAANLPKILKARQEAKKWLSSKQVQELLFKSAFTKALEKNLEEFGKASKSEKNEIKISIERCLDLFCSSLNEGIDVGKTNIDNSKIILATKAIPSCLKALEYIKSKEFIESVSRNDLSISNDARQELQKYLDFLIAKLSH